MQTAPPLPPFPQSGQMEVLVLKDAQCSETYAKTIFPFFKILSFKTNFFCSLSPILLATRSKCVSEDSKKSEKKIKEKKFF